ncbi:unnamed protein product [Heligmosomoides polygyrus]|uniref:Uncharacterized protein n=1 Tax=Heligmosomoides polygyrus TaxID=6339 RepID=A0A183G5M7_HELPZ|nr:unnamed protein product [Heligmosomoides polygyrus]
MIPIDTVPRGLSFVVLDNTPPIVSSPAAVLSPPFSLARNAPSLSRGNALRHLCDPPLSEAAFIKMLAPYMRPKRQ